MKREVKIDDRLIGDGHPTFIVAEIGINHNGDLDIAKQLIDVAKWAGADAVKFQKRTPELCVPEDQKDKMRETPWGYITYLEYRRRIEFDKKEYREIDRYCKEKGMMWFASPWDEQSVDFLEEFQPVCYKIASASLTDDVLLKRLKEIGRLLILSTGMSTMEEICKTVDFLGLENLMIAHTTSTYPCEPEELNLRMIPTLREEFPVPIGYSGHEVGLVPSTIAVSLGACLVERHITLDRALWGSDQAASVEPGGLRRLVKYIRVTEQSLGDGVKRVYESEKPSLKKLRRSFWKEDFSAGD
jgi:N-acetylneuraminate synthase